MIRQQLKHKPVKANALFHDGENRFYSYNSADKQNNVSNF
jgi:hypothetical protein